MLGLRFHAAAVNVIDGFLPCDRRDLPAFEAGEFRLIGLPGEIVPGGLHLVRPLHVLEIEVTGGHPTPRPHRHQNFRGDGGSGSRKLAHLDECPVPDRPELDADALGTSPQ